MVGLRIKAWQERLRRAITEPRSELSHWQRAVRYAYLLGLHGARRLRQGRATEMAGALAFRTLFGLLPVLVVGTLLVRVFRGWDRFVVTVEKLLTELGLNQVQVFTSDGGKSMSLGTWLLDLLSQVETINLTAIGWVGVLVLIYSALGLMITIENSFNAIYHVPRGRAWMRRLPNYWFVLCLAPAAVALTMYLDEYVARMLANAEVGSWALTLLARSWSFATIWAIMFVIYKVVPNTLVATRPALAGAFVAAVFLSVGKASFGAYLENALSIRQLYGSLGLIPLFMFWVYLMWVAVLYGLEVAATLQTVSRRELEEREPKPPWETTGLVDPAVVLGVMEMTARRFGEGRSVQPREITDALRLPEVAVARIVARLVEEGILHRVQREDGAVTLALPPERISAERLIQIGFELVDEGRPGHHSRMLDRFRAAQREIAGHSTLATLLAE